MRFILIAIFVASMSFAYAGEVQFTMADLEKAVKSEADLFKTKVEEYNISLANYNKLSNKDKKKATEPQYPVPMALKDGTEYLLFSLEEGVSRDLGMSRTKAESNCRSKLIQQFIDKDPQVFKINGSKRVSLKVSLSSINYYYRNTSYQLPDSKTYQNEDGSYLSKTTCAVSLNDVKAEGNVVAIVSY